jgi:multisubunit Na+/H+ antiporter MnhE subunit
MVKLVLGFIIGFAICYWIHNPQQVKNFYIKAERAITYVFQDIQQNSLGPTVSNGVAQHHAR